MNNVLTPALLMPAGKDAVSVFKKLHSRLEAMRRARERKHRRETVLTEAVQRVLHLSAPMVCTVRDCRRELCSPVANALAYIQQALDAIPGPVPLAPENWDHDPLLQALFIDAEEIKTLLARNRSLRSFCAKQPAVCAFALLTATKKERTIFGTAVEGDIVRRDVAQTAVEFEDHRIIDPGASLSETRRALQDRTLNALVNHVLERMLQLRSRRDELKEQQRILCIKLKIQQTRMQGLDVLSSHESAAESAPPEDHPIVCELDRQIRDLAQECDSPDEYLRQLTAVLNAPQHVLTVTPICMRLNWMGIKQNGASGDGGPDIRLAEVKLQNQLKRVAVFVTTHRQNGRTN
jgi:hypothetical protein